VCVSLSVCMSLCVSISVFLSLSQCVCFSVCCRRVDSLEKTLMLEGIGGRRRRGRQRMTWLDGTTDWMNVSLSELRELVMDREAWRAVILAVAESRTRLTDWTELNWMSILILLILWTWNSFPFHWIIYNYLY